MYPTTPPSDPKEVLTTMYDLPRVNSQRLELADKYQLLQPQLLGDTFRPPNYLVQQILVARDVKLYYDPQQTSKYKLSDWFAVVGVDPCYEQRDLKTRYRVWQEEINPFVVVDLRYPDTEIKDLEPKLPRGNPSLSKWEVYEQILRIPYYILFDSKTNHLRVCQLVDNRYKDLKLSDPRIWMNGVQLGLGLWQGTYQGINRRWLRWYDGSLKWILTHEERERKRAELLAKQLIMLGIDEGNY